ncbi:hypothetical protein KGQ90_13525 [Modicisalibacter tunisiensis]|uniref:hypothetical protein n=1 Tax=Modicisalibacter tunisiensis TaxID=390637 RepID=UPI001CCF3BDC|nr:hypothetical protein [Modicisalibacter tunisiensis]MBZ9539950.1 hypothetical protein [Modicisalibacter tunisiensis]
MDIDQLRRRHKAELVERALSIYQAGAMESQTKNYWIERLLSGHSVQEFLSRLKSGTYYPDEQETFEEAPASDSIGRLRVLDNDLELHAGLKRKLWVKLENFSGTVLQTTPEEPVFIAYHWYQENGEVYEFDGVRTPIPKPVGSGEEIEAQINLTPPAEPGNYELMVTIVHEGRCWMEDTGLAVSKAALEVQDYDGRGLTRHALSVFKQMHAAEMEVMH